MFDGPIDGASFLAYIEQVLTTLRLATSSSWTTSRVTSQPRGATSDRSRRRQLWFLPKYSPDFNPIELAFAKLKAILRKARCRTREVLWNTIGAAVPGIQPRNYFRQLGRLRAS